MRTHIRSLAAIMAVLLLPAAAINAQTAPSRSNQSTEDRSSPKDEEIVVMSPFVVSTDKDTGYIAADTLNAGLLNSNLLMTPGNIDVLTRDLLNDLGVFNIDQASAWLTNSRPLELGATEGNSMNPGSLAQSDSGTNVSLRGLGANPSTRNYFTSAATPKEYNVERVESSRGPNAILYGEGGPGGGINYITKKAKSRNFTTLRLRFDDNLSKGAALDINRKLTDQLDLRYNLNLLHHRYFIDRTDFKEIDHALSATYRPFEGTSITVDVDITRNTRPGLILAYGEQYAKWDHVPVTSKTITPDPGRTLAQTLTDRGLALWGGGKNLVWIDGIGMLDLAGYVHSAGYGLPQPTEYRFGDAFFPSLKASTPSHPPGITALPELAKTFNANPTDIDVTDRAKDLQLAVDHVFKNKVSMQLAGQYSQMKTTGGNYYFTTIYLDVLQNFPDGTVNPNYNKPYANSYVGRTINYERNSKTVRFVTAYPLELGRTTTNISAFVTHQEKNDTTVYTDLHIKDPASTLSITDASSLIHVNRYFDDLTTDLPDFRSLYDTVDVPVADGRNHQKLDAVELALSGRYLHDTLSVIAGVRRDRSELTSENGVAASRDTQTGAYTNYTTDSRKAYNNTTTFGFVYFPIKYVGVYANHGEGFIIQTVSNPHLDGTLAKANIVPAKENSVGLRFNLGGESAVKVVGSIGYYKAEQERSAFSVGVGNINTLWRDLSLFETAGASEDKYADKIIHTLLSDPYSTSAANSITSSRSTVGSGWEASLTANIGNSFRLTVNGALPKTKQSAVGADYVDYVNQNFATWQALANNPTNPYRTNNLLWVNQLTQAITNFQEGREQNLTYDYRANIFGIYTFRGNPLKGLRVGGGANFFGHSLVGNAPGNPYDYVYAKAYYLMNAQIGYPFKIGKYNVDMQLNIDNLLGYEDNIYNGVIPQTIRGQTINIPYGTKNVWPRAARLTVTIPF